MSKHIYVNIYKYPLRSTGVYINCFINEEVIHMFRDISGGSNYHIKRFIVVSRRKESYHKPWASL